MDFAFRPLTRLEIILGFVLVESTPTLNDEALLCPDSKFSPTINLEPRNNVEFESPKLKGSKQKSWNHYGPGMKLCFI